MSGESEREESTAGLAGVSSVAQLEAIIHHLPTAVLVAEAGTGRLMLSNDRVGAIWRRPLGPVEEDAEAVSWDAFHLDGSPSRGDEWPLIRTAVDGETIEGEELEIVRGDGSRGVIRICSTPVRDETGKLVAAVATVEDITEQRGEERRRHFLAEVSALLVSSLSYGTTLRNVAKLSVPELADWCAVDILGEGGRVDRLAVEFAVDLPEDVAVALAHRCPKNPEAPGGVARVLRTGEAELALEDTGQSLEAVAADAEQLGLLRALRACAVMIVPLVARGKTIGALTFVSVRPQRLYGERDLELAQELATRAALAIDNARLYHETQAASRAKSDFLAIMSHELRTPLTAIIGYAELLELGIPEPVTESQREQIERIEVAARHLQQLIEEILAVASLEAGEAKIRRQEVSVAELLHRAEVIIRPMAMAKELRLEVEGVAEPVVVETDPEKLLQVLLNLLTNAVKFTESGSIRLGARVQGGKLELEVDDTGIGVHPRDHDRIFEPFWQVDQPITRRAGGTGLGLTISRRLVDLLAGEIRVESEPQRGSRFLVRVPLRLPD
ncbi:MAG TPA: ATP-binding protein [Longimicrobiaceae bacterium]